MKVLVTGATGLLGSHVLEQGLLRGHEMRATVRSILPRTFLAKHAGNVELIQCDLQNDELSTRNLHDIEVIIHCAALAAADPAASYLMEKINDEVPRKLYARAAEAGVSKWVQVSTTAVMTPASASSPGSLKPLITESDFGSLRDTPYARSKYAFDLFLESNPLKLKTLSVHPGYMLGRWDAKPSSGAILFGLRMGRFKHYVDQQKSFVAARDVAVGIWQALEAGREGRFILTGQNKMISEFLRMACTELGIGFDAKEVAIAEMAQIPEVERAFVKEFCMTGAASHEKARTSFNYSPSISVSAMIKEAVDYFVENRMLKRATPR